MAKKIFVIIAALSSLLTSGKTYVSNDIVSKADVLEPPSITVSVSGTYPDDISHDVISDFEGCSDRFVWPGMNSGPTIGCGIDLGNIGRRNIKRLFENLVEDSILQIMLEGSRVRGSESVRWIRRNSVKLSKTQVSLSRDRMLSLMWKETVRRFPSIKEAPGEVKTAILSLALNRGPNNPALKTLRSNIENENWSALATQVAAMQQDHEFVGISDRRKQEASLIRLAEGN